MQMLHPHSGSIQQYLKQIDDPDAARPSSCPQCPAREPLTAHGFYNRTLTDEAFDGVIRIRRYLCQPCQRTVSLLPEWALPYLRFSIAVIAKTLKRRLVEKRAWPASEPYQRGQHWVSRFTKQAEALSAAMAGLTAVVTASCFVTRALGMLEKTEWIGAHRFLFAGLRMHLLGWGPSLAPHGRRITIDAAPIVVRRFPHTTCMEGETASG